MDPIILTHTPPDGIPFDAYLTASAPPFEDEPTNDLYYRSSTLQAQAPTQSLYPLSFDYIFEDYAAEDSRVQLQSFFTNPNQIYTYEPSTSSDLIDNNNFKEDIKNLPFTHYAQVRAFQPYQTELNTRSPIHLWLKNISEKFFATNKELPLSEKIKLAEQFTNQFIIEVILEYSTIASFQEQPFFPCLEIALRAHLFNKILEKENHEITFIIKTNESKFPDDLAERENALEALLTKNGFFINPYLYFYNEMIPTTTLGSSIESCISKTNLFPINSAIDSTETLIQTTLLELNLVKPSRTSWFFECQLRDALGKILLSKYTQHFKEQFQKTGTISLEDFNNISTKIYNILSNHGNIQIQIYVKYEVLKGIFALRNDFSFQDLRNQIEAERSARPASSGASKFFSFLSRSTVTPADTSQQKLATLAWAEQEWINIFPPQLDLFANLESSEPVASAPQIIEDPAPPVEPIPVQFETSSLEDDWELVRNPEPLNIDPIIEPAPIKIPRPAQPLPPSVSNDLIVEVVAPKKIEPIQINADSPNIPLVSYINIAFANCMKWGDDLTAWNSLPQINRKDALRHCYYLSNYTGKAEEIAVRLFKTVTEIQRQLMTPEYSSSLQPSKTKLSPAFIEKGEALLSIYYSQNPVKFFQEFQSLPKEPLFYQYVYEMAKASGVHIASWDHRFAENNWNKITMINLSVQALERCLHTDS